MSISSSISEAIRFDLRPATCGSDATMVGTGGLGKDVELALWSLHIDKVAASVTEELDARGIASILLKGPAIATWLYRDGTPRPYGDADLMVAPADWARAQNLLLELGFTKDLGPMNHPGMGSLDSESWVRGTQNIDLHCTIWGFEVDPEHVWATLSASTEPIDVGGRQLQMLGSEARALLLGTHAAKHGDGWAVTDLERALRLLPFDAWQRAAALALELDAARAFASGLTLIPEGREVVTRLGLEHAVSVEAVLRAVRVPMALGLEQLSQTQSLHAKIEVIRSELFPTPAFMRWWSGLARSGRAGLVAAYAWRVIWLSGHAVPAVRAWRRARRGAAAMSASD